MSRDIEKKTIVKTQIYLKYGFVRTQSMACHCPACDSILNAGPNYQPRYCSECGQRISFSGIKWEDEKILGYGMEAALGKGERRAVQ